MRAQAEQCWHGDVAEIGVFEGRFLIALMLCLHSGERAIAIDTFDWPDRDIGARFAKRLRAFNLIDAVDILKMDSRQLGNETCLEESIKRKIRFFHIDGDHDAHSLGHDFSVAVRCMAPWGVICLDDMLSPAYPELAVTVAKMLDDNRDWKVFCVVDRESISASSKYLICRSEYFHFYITRITPHFKANIWRMGAQFATYKALVLSPKPTLDWFRPGGKVSSIS
jgi:hypothetical protein